jgi:hypothetical protein
MGGGSPDSDLNAEQHSFGTLPMTESFAEVKLGKAPSPHVGLAPLGAVVQNRLIGKSNPRTGPNLTYSAPALA